MALLHLAPALPPQDRRRVDQEDPLHHRIAHDPDPGQASGAERLEGISCTRCLRRRSLPDIGFNRFEHRLEQSVLPPEVVIEGSPAGAGCLQD
jgi:hypothetical protein